MPGAILSLLNGAIDDATPVLDRVENDAGRFTPEDTASLATIISRQVAASDMPPELQAIFDEMMQRAAAWINDNGRRAGLLMTDSGEALPDDPSKATPSPDTGKE